MQDLEIKSTYKLVVEKIESWVNTAIEMLPNFLMAVLIVVAFWLLARGVRKLLKKGLNRVSDNQSLINLGSTVIYITVLAVGTFVALSVLHLDKAVTSLLAGVGVVGLALGFAFQDIAANFVAGVLIATRKPYNLGDLVETNSHFGTVQDVNLRSTTIRTFQGQDVIIPNKEVFQKPLVNYTLFPKRRVDIEVGVSYGDDLEKAKSLALNAIQALDIIDQTQEVTLYYDSFGDSSINFTIRYWVDEHDHPVYLEARSAGIMAIKKAYEDNGITIPFPIRTLDFGIKGGQNLKETPIPYVSKEAKFAN